MFCPVRIYPQLVFYMNKSCLTKSIWTFVSFIVSINSSNVRLSQYLPELSSAWAFLERSWFSFCLHVAWWRQPHQSGDICINWILTLTWTINKCVIWNSHLRCQPSYLNLNYEESRHHDLLSAGRRISCSLLISKAHGWGSWAHFFFSPPPSCAQPLSKEPGSSVWRLSDDQPRQEGYDSMLGLGLQGGARRWGDIARGRGHRKNGSCMLSTLGQRESVDKRVRTEGTNWVGRALLSWWGSMS